MVGSRGRRRARPHGWCGVSDPEVIQAETLRNIGCCGLAAATTGREHFSSCLNWQPPAPQMCEVCKTERHGVTDGLCRTCRFVAHCEGYDF